MSFFVSYFHCRVCILEIVSLKRSSATWRLVVVSPASKQENTQVFCTELGIGTFTICSVILKEFPPLSPPIFTQISLAGMIPLCHVRRFSLIDEESIGKVSYMYMYACMCNT